MVRRAAAMCAAARQAMQAATTQAALAVVVGCRVDMASAPGGATQLKLSPAQPGRDLGEMRCACHMQAQAAKQQASPPARPSFVCDAAGMPWREPAAGPGDQASSTTRPRRVARRAPVLCRRPGGRVPVLQLHPRCQRRRGGGAAAGRPGGCPPKGGGHVHPQLWQRGRFHGQPDAGAVSEQPAAGRLTDEVAGLPAGRGMAGGWREGRM